MKISPLSCAERGVSTRRLGYRSGTPNPYNLSEKYWQYISNLYRSAPPICNALPCWVLNFGERETLQYTSNLYYSTPPICTTIRLPFVPAILLRKYQGHGGSRKVPDTRSSGYLSVPKNRNRNRCVFKSRIQNRNSRPRFRRKIAE